MKINLIDLALVRSEKNTRKKLRARMIVALGCWRCGEEWKVVVQEEGVSSDSGQDELDKVFRGLAEEAIHVVESSVDRFVERRCWGEITHIQVSHMEPCQQCSAPPEFERKPRERFLKKVASLVAKKWQSK